MKNRRLISAAIALGILPSTAAIIEAEYFINADPGQGNGVAIPIQGDGTTLDVAVSSSLIAPLSVGFHQLGVRFKNDQGGWSNAEYRVFRKNPPEIAEPDTTSPIASLEIQWYQNNTAVTPQITIPANPAGDSYSFSELASLAGLTEGGTYQILFTPINDEGQRGLWETRTVNIQTTDTDGDGVPDQWENTYGFNPNDPSDLLAGNDFDSDGVNDKDEFLGGSDPTKGDTDGDGIADSVEINLASLGLDPAVPNPELTELINNSLTDGYSLEDLRRLKPGAPILLPDPTTGKFTMTMEWQKSDDIVGGFEFMPLSPEDILVDGEGRLEVEIAPVPGETKAFYRIESNE